MSLRERLEERGEDLIDKKGAEALDDLLKMGEGLLNDSDLSVEEAEAGIKVLDHLKENKAPFVRLGHVGFARLMAYWEDGDETAAELYYREFEATFEERIAATQREGDALVGTRDAEIEAWESVKAVLKGAGTFGLKFLVKVAARVIGIPL